MKVHKKHLRDALLLAHQKRSWAKIFGHLVKDFISTMSNTKKGLALSTMALFGLIITAGVVGPSAASVAHAEAQNTINRALGRLANLSDEDKQALEQKLQDKMQLMRNRQENFQGLKELDPEEIEAFHQERKASLAESLTEAKNAPDLIIISADEMPVPGFIGRAGRAIGFRMMKPCDSPEEKLAILPKDIRQRLEERSELHEEMKPVSFLVYTNSNGQKVTLGINANDEPVVQFIQPADGEFPPMPPRKGMNKR